MNKYIKRHVKFYNRMLRFARMNDLWHLQDCVSLLKTIHSSKRLDKVAKKYGTFYDWANKDSFEDRLHHVPLYTIKKGKRISLEKSRGVTKEQWEAEDVSL